MDLLSSLQHLQQDAQGQRRGLMEELAPEKINYATVFAHSSALLQKLHQSLTGPYAQLP